MLRTSLFVLTLSIAACGIDPTIPAVEDEAPLVAATPAPPLRGEVLNASAPLRLRPQLETVHVHSLSVPDGTQVKYVLGMMGCGISIAARGTATVQGGAFEIPFDPSFGTGDVSLFFTLAETCDPETSQVYEVPASLPGSVDLSTMPEASFIGCWLFD